ncbi:MAG: hypothetical protein RL701_309 [Pseudomonadota bacterium]|jgi:predicted SprT family Zn-dependent metalloprotease
MPVMVPVLVNEAAAVLTPDALPQRITALELALRERFGIPLRLTVTDNRRTMLSIRRRRTLVEVRLHHMFLCGGEALWATLGEYLFEGDLDAATLIARYVEKNRDRIRRAKRRRIPLATAGTHHDLDEIYRAVNARYFENSVEAKITWGRDATQQQRAVRRSIKLGSYTARDRLIRIHPALDADFVPRFFVEYIVYHEMLHYVVPPTVRRGRRDLHGANFTARERQFHDYPAALIWERDNLDRLLRSRPKRARRAAASQRSA